MNIIKADNLDRHDGVSHGFFGRQGGLSEGIYTSLNCGSGSDDNPDHVHKNRELIAGHFGQEARALQTVWQIHSPDCLYIDNVNGDRPKADAMVTDQAGIILGVLTADCGPVLFTGEKQDGSPIIGAAHAGWRGAIGGVLDSTVNAMREKGVVLESISAAIGPCIGPASYEVSESFLEPFLQESDDNERFFKETNKNNKLMFDLPAYIAARLSGLGVKNVAITGHDTFTDEDGFFSYRRTTHRGEPDYGRQISGIVIKSV